MQRSVIDRIMMLDYEWTNPAAAAAAAMLLFGDGGEVGPTPFDQYGANGNGLAAGDLFAPTAAGGLFSPVGAPAASGQRYGMGMPAAVAAPARIGLNLGVRTYFSSASPEEEMGMGMGMGRVCRRRARMARCQAEGCGADLTHAKHYHRRHKVCEFHSKASIVIAAGLSQRFCQQCSRFHVLSEFDQGKRSCRKRLADHNRRRRKSQDLTTINTLNNNDNNNNNNNNSNSTITTATNNSNNTALLHFESSSSSNNNNNNNMNMGSSMDQCNPEIGSTVTRAPSPAMALGLGCGAIAVSSAPAGLSGSSSTTVTSPPRISFFSHLGEIRAQEHRFLSWDDGDDGSSIRSLYQSK
ncbi:hypothetical protein KFK09_017978 [Dendrobium nobile]|uniref:SBP-type domain-containing protein n=1 Tax=Dendrobium nobile TaxID=94219 RepID=A0A8T3AUG6_DENNO|nr:hypothetical protein KFK09_017978 [Dendrobium nobile]